MTNADFPSTEKLRDSLIAAMEVARAGLKEKPPIDPPPRLKRFVGFAKFTRQALGQVRAVVEDDEEFRERVAAGIDENGVGRIGWLWLTRPEGWEDECRELAAAAEEQSERQVDAQSIRALEQKLERAEAAAERAERQREKAERDREAARTQATQAQAEVRKAAGDVEALTAEREELAEGKKASEDQLDRVQRQLARAEAKLKSAQAKSSKLDKELRDSRRQHEVETGELEQRLAEAENEVALAREAGFEPPAEPEPEPPDMSAESPTKRIPADLPPGMLRDTVEAAEHLMRHVPNLAVLVDGYNVTHKSWGELPVQEQRQRFLQKVEEMSARYAGTEFVVVFDGQQVDYDYIQTTPRSVGVKVEFSTPPETADDRIASLCGAYPKSRPIAVVSQDNEVRQQARDQGANLIHPHKLLEMMGVEVDDPLAWP